MLAATRMSRLRVRFAELHPTVRLAVFVWAGMAIAVSVRVAFSHKDAGSVFPVYRTAATAWTDGVDLYTLDFSKPCFRYHPLIAAAFVPLNLLPEKAAAILWRWLGVALFLYGMQAWLRQFWPRLASPTNQGIFVLLASPLALQSLNNAQVNLHLIGIILLAMVAADRQRWTTAAALIAIATTFKLYPIAIGLLMSIVLPRAFVLRYAATMGGTFLVPFALQHPDYVAAQYRLWLQYLFVDARHTAAIEQAPRDLFLLVRFWFGLPSEGLYRLVQLTSAAALACWCLAARPNLSVLLPAILHLGCIWMTLLGPSTESSTYTLLAPTAAILLISTYIGGPKPVFTLSLIGYTLLILPTLAAAFPGGTRLQHFGPQPAGAVFLLAATIAWIQSEIRNPQFEIRNSPSAPCCRAEQFP